MLNHKTFVLSFVTVLFCLFRISLSANDMGLFYRISSLTEINTGDTIIIVGDDSSRSGTYSFLPYVRSVFDIKSPTEKYDFTYREYSGEKDYCISPDSNYIWVVNVTETKADNKHIQLCHPFAPSKNWLTNTSTGNIHTGINSANTKTESSRFIIKEFNGDFSIVREKSTSCYLLFKGAYWYMSASDTSTVNRHITIHKRAQGLSLKKEKSTLIFSGKYDEEIIRRIVNRAKRNGIFAKTKCNFWCQKRKGIFQQEKVIERLLNSGSRAFCIL